MLSACLTVFGSPAVALRGVSYLCSLFSLTLLYRIGKKRIKGAAALIPVFLFAGINIVNQLAVQGRGYALVTFCYLMAVYELQKMAEEKEERLSGYVLFSGALLMALWAIPSSVYMVLPVCIAGGFYFLLSGKKKKLFHLILASLASAAGTAFLYGLLWLAIGSNLLAKTEGSLYYGMGHFQILRKAPIQALREGIDYMLASPYIQSVPREGFLARFAAWLQTLLDRGGGSDLSALPVLSDKRIPESGKKVSAGFFCDLFPYFGADAAGDADRTVQTAVLPRLFLCGGAALPDERSACGMGAGEQAAL